MQHAHDVPASIPTGPCGERKQPPGAEFPARPSPRVRRLSLVESRSGHPLERAESPTELRPLESDFAPGSRSRSWSMPPLAASSFATSDEEPEPESVPRPGLLVHALGWTGAVEMVTPSPKHVKVVADATATTAAMATTTTSTTTTAATATTSTTATTTAAATAATASTATTTTTATTASIAASTLWVATTPARPRAGTVPAAPQRRIVFASTLKQPVIGPLLRRFDAVFLDGRAAVFIGTVTSWLPWSAPEYRYCLTGPQKRAVQRIVSGKSGSDVELVSGTLFHTRDGKGWERAGRAATAPMTRHEVRSCRHGDMLELHGRLYLVKGPPQHAHDPDRDTLLLQPLDANSFEELPHEPARRIHVGTLVSGAAVSRGPDVLLDEARAVDLACPKRVRFFDPADGFRFSAECASISTVSGALSFSVEAKGLSAATVRKLQSLGCPLHDGRYTVAGTPFVVRVDSRELVRRRGAFAPAELAAHDMKRAPRIAVTVDGTDAMLEHARLVRDRHLLTLTTPLPQLALCALDPHATVGPDGRTRYQLWAGSLRIDAAPGSVLKQDSKRASALEDSCARDELPNRLASDAETQRAAIDTWAGLQAMASRHAAGTSFDLWIGKVLLSAMFCRFGETRRFGLRLSIPWGQDLVALVQALNLESALDDADGLGVFVPLEAPRPPVSVRKGSVDTTYEDAARLLDRWDAHAKRLHEEGPFALALGRTAVEVTGVSGLASCGRRLRVFVPPGPHRSALLEVWGDAARIYARDGEEWSLPRPRPRPREVAPARPLPQGDKPVETKAPAEGAKPRALAVSVEASDDDTAPDPLFGGEIARPATSMLDLERKLAGVAAQWKLLLERFDEGGAFKFAFNGIAVTVLRAGEPTAMGRRRIDFFVPAGLHGDQLLTAWRPASTRGPVQCGEVNGTECSINAPRSHGPFPGVPVRRPRMTTK